MLRSSAWHLSRLWSLALRRLIAACVVLAIGAAPVAAGLTPHHVDDLDGPAFVMAGSAVVAAAVAKDGDAGAAKHVVPAADHDCHGCAAVLLPSASHTRIADVVAVLEAAGPALDTGRAIPADPRPPRA